MTKRLFIFAGYDPQGIVDDTLLHYLNALSKLGDIVLTMDTDLAQSEIDKLKTVPNILNIAAARHGEYDFGSYKRGYLWAYDKKILKKYDWIYFANDSVYGPLFDLEPVLQNMESSGLDFTGIIDYETPNEHRFIQSWFLGMTPKIAMSDWLHDFMDVITRQNEKASIIFKYEQGLSRLIVKHGYDFYTFISGQNGSVCHEMYAAPLVILKRGVPFLKKTQGGIQKLPHIAYLYPLTEEKFVEQIVAHHDRTTPKEQSVIITGRPKRYEKSFRASFLAIPLLSIYRQCDNRSRHIAYKVFLFDMLPVFKFHYKPMKKN